MRSSEYYYIGGKYDRMSGCLEPPDSPEYQRWLAALPPYLREIMIAELADRQAKKSSRLATAG